MAQPLATQAVTYWARAIGAARSRQRSTQAHKDLERNRSHHARSCAEQRRPSPPKPYAQDYQEAAGLDRSTPKAKTTRQSPSCAPSPTKNDKLGDEPESIPAREMLADLLLEAKRPQQALAEYQIDLKLNPNRFNGLYGAASAAGEAGKQSEASEYYVMLIKICAGGTSTRPELGKLGNCSRKNSHVILSEAKNPMPTCSSSVPDRSSYYCCCS